MLALKKGLDFCSHTLRIKGIKPQGKKIIGEETIAFWIYEALAQEIIDFNILETIKPKLSW